MQDLIEKIESLQKQVDDALDFLKIPQLRSRLAELEAEMQKPGFWDNQREAQKLSKEHGALSQAVSAWSRLSADLASAKEMTGLLSELKNEKDYDDFEQSITDLEKRYAELEIELYLNGKYDLNPALLSVHAGAGGTDAQDWAEMLLRMYTRYAEAKGWATTLLEKSEGEEAGIKSATLRIEGNHTYGLLKEEAGTHRLVRLSPFNAKHTRETAFALVEVVPEIDEDEVEINKDDLRVDVFRAGGRGGQGVNTTDSAVRITHLPTGIVVQCQNERSQLQNKETAMKTLLSKLIALQEKNRLAEIGQLKGEHVEGSWGNQIRSYVLHPYKMVKDHRTDCETSNIEAVLEGDPNELDVFIERSLKSHKD